MDIQEYIKSGAIENYILGLSTAGEVDQLKQLCAQFPQLFDEIYKVEESLMKYSESLTGAPPTTIKPFVLASIDFSERVKKGERPASLPILNEKSGITDYKEWLDKPEMVLPAGSDDIFAKIIGYTAQAVTAIVWIKTGSPPEVHDDEYEKFLIVEGTCHITIGDKVHSMVPGDYLSIPLHVSHHVKVTSDIPCKVVLQRVAA